MRWIYNFLVCRQIKVAWDNTYSPAYPSAKGISQGAVLSHILFTISMSSDFFDVLGHLGYADDIFIYVVGDTLDQGSQKLQITLRDISLWCGHWKLSIRPDKCHVINLSRSKGD